MNKAEFDQFADEYNSSLRRVLGISGESPDYFAEYKIADVRLELDASLTPEKILDFGSGVGSSIPFIERYFADSKLICLDVSEKSLAIAASRFPGSAELMLFDGETLPLEDNSVDLSFAACVFHHIDHEAHAGLLAEIMRVLKPGGHFFVFEHNPNNPLTVRAVNQCVFDENAVLISGKTMRTAFARAGFSSIKLKYRVFFPGALRFLRPLESWLTRIPLGGQYFVMGQKEP